MRNFIIIINILFSTYVFQKPAIKCKKIINSGDGKSIETAYRVNSFDDEYLVLDYLKLRPISQKLITKRRFFLDAISLVSR